MKFSDEDWGIFLGDADQNEDGSISAAEFFEFVEKYLKK